MMFFGFIKDLYRQRRLVWELAKRDYRQKNEGSLLGVVWNYLQPILFVGVMYMVFTFGFRTGAATDIPFGLYLISGMVCWIYFSDNISNITGVISSYSFLIKKVNFRLSVLPLVKLISSLFPHIGLTFAVIIVAYFSGYSPTIYTLQIFYYLFCMMVLLTGIGWITSSTSIFVKDVGNLVSVFVQFGFWLTPIFWRLEIMPQKLQAFLKLNPAYYLVTGYRDAIFSQKWFWQKPNETMYYWALCLIICVLGVFVFKKLRPHFAEVM